MGDVQSVISRDNIVDVIDRVYEVALDAGRYEELRHSWERLQAETEVPRSIDQTEAHIAKHFERAVQVLQLVSENDRKDQIQLLLERFESVAAMVIGPDLAIRKANATAIQSFGLTAETGLAHLPVDPDDRRALTSHLAKLLNDDGSKVSVFRVRAVPNDGLLVFQMQRFTLDSGENVILAATSSLHWPEGFASVLKSAFDLSSAEIEIARLLVECCSLKEIAETRGRSMATIRAQVKACFAKTETRNQVELVRLVMSMMDIAAHTIGQPGQTAVSDIDCTLPNVPYRKTRTADGRSLDYQLLGDPNGKPVLFITTEYGYSRWTASAEQSARDRGLCIISPIRAGYADSDPLPRKTPFCEGIAADLLCVLDTLGVRRLPVVSMSDDHHFATQMEKMRPGTMTALIAAAGGLPFLHPGQVQRMDKWFRFIQAAARHTPRLLAPMIQIGMHLILKVGREKFARMIYADSPADSAALNDPEVMEALVVGSYNCLSERGNGTRTFIRQTLFEQEPWLVDHVHWLKDRVPAHFLLGLHDPSMPPETIAEHQVEFDWIDFRLFPDTGQLLLFTKWREVLDLVEDYA